jgi:hypothetical protein
MRKQKVTSEQRQVAQPNRLVQGMMASLGRKDGHPLPLRRVNDAASVGGVEMYGLDLSSAPIPQRRYAAELCSVLFEKNEAKLIFAQPQFGSDVLESALVIRMSPVAVTQLAESIHAISSPTLAEICERVDIEPEEISIFTSHPKNVANAVANICSIAISGHETCMDFYHASAFAAKKSESSDELEVDPVVRVDIRTALLVPLIQCIFDIETKILARKKERTI